MTVGTGPLWLQAAPVFGVRPGKDGNLHVLGGNGFYRVDPTSGARVRARDLAGVPAENSIDVAAAFDVDDAGSYFVVLTHASVGGGVGILRFDQGGAAVVTLSGATNTGRNRGSGPNYSPSSAGSGYGSLRLHGGRGWLVNDEDHTLVSVDLASGDRVVVSDADSGISVDGGPHDIRGGSLIFDSAAGVAYVHSTLIYLVSGNRAFASPFFTHYYDLPRKENAIGGLNGAALHFDPTTGVLYELRPGQIVAAELRTGNANVVTR